jgi:hypothetical protein
MTIARRDIVTEGVAGTYHCTARCVRQAHLCGADKASGRTYDHRKGWVRERLQFLAGVFAVEVLGYAAMSNHLHSVVRTEPERAAGWSDEEVARRWRVLCPTQRMRAAGERAPGAGEIAAVLRAPGRVGELRRRLGSLSWFMRCLNEHVARRANREDGCTGRFWEGRYKCRGLADAAAVLTALVYVDLNPVRAGVAATPEGSADTSVGERVAAWRAGRRATAGGPVEEAAAGGWLCPLSDGAGRRGVFRRLTLAEYLALVDRAGRVARPGKAGVIGAAVAPILERLELAEANWVEAVTGYEGHFRRMVGRAEAVAAAAEAAGRRWFQGITACRRLLGPPRSAGESREA